MTAVGQIATPGMNRVLLMVIGGPGTGKSTLVRTLTDHLARKPQEPSADAPARDWLMHPRDPVARRPFAVELGRRRLAFSGTDALPSAVIRVAEPWLRNQVETDRVIVEGARLANRRFLKAALVSGYNLRLVLLDHSDADHWRAERAEALALRPQAPSWVKGRFTAARNLADWAMEFGLPVLIGHPEEMAPRLRGMFPA